MLEEGLVLVGGGSRRVGARGVVIVVVVVCWNLLDYDGILLNLDVFRSGG